MQINHKNSNLRSTDTSTTLQSKKTSPIPSLPNEDDKKKMTLAELFVRSKPYIKPIWVHLFLGLLSACLMATMALLSPQVLHWIIDIFMSSNATVANVALAAFLFTLFRVLEAACSTLRRKLVVGPSTEVEKKMRIEFYDHIQDLDLAFHSHWSSGQLLSRVLGDVSKIRRGLAFTAVMFITNIFTVIAGLFILLSIAWQLSLVIILASIPAIISQVYYIKKYSELTHKTQNQISDLSTQIEESVLGIQILKSFGTSYHSLKSFSKQAKKLQKTEFAKSKLDGLLLVPLTLPELSLGLCLFLGITMAVNNTISIGALAAFFTTATIVFGPLYSLVSLISNLINMKIAAERYFAVMDINSNINFPTLKTNENSPVNHDPSHAISLNFENVHFHYPDAEKDQKDLLDGIDLNIKPGETMAIVGESGTGKTSLLNLVLRLFDVTNPPTPQKRNSRITIDGTDIRDLEKNDLRKLVSVAFEDPTIFSDTIKNNILLGNNNLSEADLRQAIEIAQADFIYELKDGIDTEVGENGLRLSGGQRQRIALARSIAAEPKILLLDDPLSALDATTEEKVTNYLKNSLKNTTKLIIAHRSSTVALADRVALLEDGKIVAVGSHEELLTTNHNYRHIISGFNSVSKSANDLTSITNNDHAVSSKGGEK